MPVENSMPLMPLQLPARLFCACCFSKRPPCAKMLAGGYCRRNKPGKSGRCCAVDNKLYEKAAALRHALHAAPEPSGREAGTKRMLQQFLHENAPSLNVTDRGAWFYAVYRCGRRRAAHRLPGGRRRAAHSGEKQPALCLALPGRGAQMRARWSRGRIGGPGLPHMRRGRAVRCVFYFPACGRDGRGRRRVRRPSGRRGHRRSVRLSQYAGAGKGHGVPARGHHALCLYRDDAALYGRAHARQHAGAGQKPCRRCQRACVRAAGLHSAHTAQGHSAGHRYPDRCWVRVPSAYLPARAACCSPSVPSCKASWMLCAAPWPSWHPALQSGTAWRWRCLTARRSLNSQRARPRAACVQGMPRRGRPRRGIAGAHALFRGFRLVSAKEARRHFLCGRRRGARAAARRYVRFSRRGSAHGGRCVLFAIAQGF